MVQFHKQEIAKRQLQTAVFLYLNGMDRSSVITLAGAASGILDTLVRQAGKEPFVDFARRVHRELVGFTPKRKSYFHHINIRLGVIAHKHLSKADPEFVELDLEKLSFDALARAMNDYVILYGKEEPFVNAFYSYAWTENDGPSLMERFKQVPRSMRPR